MSALATWEYTFPMPAAPLLSTVSFDGGPEQLARVTWVDGAATCRVMNAPTAPRVVRVYVLGHDGEETTVVFTPRCVLADPTILGSPAWVEEQLRGIRESG